jgi:DNA-binding NtrC family response regulator
MFSKEGANVYECSALIGSSTIIRHVQHLVLKVSESELPLLITGELGTNKEAVAQFIHNHSQRAQGPFITFKCLGKKTEDIEKELFLSFSKGKGLLEMAHGGAVYIEEVTLLPMPIQEKLLKFLNDGLIENGDTKSYYPVDVRIICSNSTNVEQHIRNGLFKQELFYKLSSSSIYVPPIRERREDISAIVEFFIKKFNESRNKKIQGVSHDALNALLQYTWPNNIQELENLIERIVVLKNTGSIQISDLPPKIRRFVTDDINDYFVRSLSQATKEQENYPYENEYYFNNGKFGNENLNSVNAPYLDFGRQEFYPSHAPSKMNGVPSGVSSPSNYAKDYPSPAMSPSSSHSNGSYNRHNEYLSPSNTMYSKAPSVHQASFEEGPSEIDQFIKKEIDLGSGIDFYKVVEEFENRLISEALRRTNHNKNRAAQLLSMNRTTLVEKLKKRASSSHPKPTEVNRIKKSAGFTIFDGLGAKSKQYESLEIINFKRSDFEDK